MPLRTPSRTPSCHCGVRKTAGDEGKRVRKTAGDESRQLTSAAQQCSRLGSSVLGGGPAERLVDGVDGVVLRSSSGAGVSARSGGLKLHDTLRKGTGQCALAHRGGRPCAPQPPIPYNQHDTATVLSAAGCHGMPAEAAEQAGHGVQRLQQGRAVWQGQLWRADLLEVALVGLVGLEAQEELAVHDAVVRQGRVRQDGGGGVVLRTQGALHKCARVLAGMSCHSRPSAPACTASLRAQHEQEMQPSVVPASLPLNIAGSLAMRAMPPLTLVCKGSSVTRHQWVTLCIDHFRAHHGCW